MCRFIAAAAAGRDRAGAGADTDALPQPTGDASAQILFTADRTTINQGRCTTIRWSVEMCRPSGSIRRPALQQFRGRSGFEEVCPPVTTTFEMRVQMRDGSVQFRQVTISVTPAACRTLLNGTNWEVTSFNNGRNAVVSPLSSAARNQPASAPTVTGSSGCNDFRLYWVKRQQYLGRCSRRRDDGLC